MPCHFMSLGSYRLRPSKIIGAFIAKSTLKENLAFFERAEVTVGPIYDALQLMNDEHVRARGSIVEYPDDGGSK